MKLLAQINLAVVKMEKDHCKKVCLICTSINVITCLCSAIELRIDRRCTLADLKTRLEEYVQVPSSDFKVSLTDSKCHHIMKYES